MDKQQEIDSIVRKYKKLEGWFYITLLVLMGTLIAIVMSILGCWPYTDISNFPSETIEEKTPEEIVEGIHVETGMIYDDDFSIVRQSCLSCHSSRLITQNRATREGWTTMIRWMQKTQGLPDLGDKEPAILNYLARNYAPIESGRRNNLPVEDIKWYVLEL